MRPKSQAGHGSGLPASPAEIRKAIPPERIRAAIESYEHGDFSGLAKLYEETGLWEYADPYYWHRFLNAQTATEKVQVHDEWITNYPSEAHNYPRYGDIAPIIPSLREAAKREQDRGVISQTFDAQLSERLQRGKLCDQFIQELKQIRSMVVNHGRTVAELQHNYPDFFAWKLVPGLPGDDRDTFMHPGRWGPVVGYGKGLLAKHYGVSSFTITDWVKEYRVYKRSLAT